MVLLQWFAVFLFAFTFVSAKPLPEEWKRVHDAHPEEIIELIFAMKQTNLTWLEQRFWSVSDPRSPDYAKYMTFDEISKIVKADEAAVLSVMQILRRANAVSIDSTKGNCFFVVRMHVSSANELFKTTFGSYVHVDQPETIVHKAIQYEIPHEIAKNVDYIFGIDNFPKLRKDLFGVMRQKPLAPMAGNNPKTISSRYNISDYESTNSGNSQAIASFLNQYFNPDDLKKFQSRYSVPDNPITKIDGENNAEKPGLEATLDVEYITSVAKKVATWFVYTPGLVNNGQEDFLKWIIGQTNTSNSPWVHSVSYGDIESSIPDTFKTSVDNEFKKFGLSGRTVIYASGDTGVGCHNDKFNPNWPASSPYVTTVGGTTSGLNEKSEEAWQDGGGGFSNFFPMPEYQKTAVEKYLKSGKAPPTRYFNSSGRAYPDVSALATEFEILYHDTTIGVDGTSCAAPTFAAVVSLLNDVRLNKEKPTLGFLNPLLYQIAGKGFHDVTEGRNPHEMCPGFEATKGWDPASGWGSPNFGLLKFLV